MADTQTCGRGEVDCVKFKVSTRTGKKGGIEVTLMVVNTAVGARQAAGLNASQTARHMAQQLSVLQKNETKKT